MNDLVETRRLERHHAAIWAVIDDIAARNQISTSRLAILTGHDSTTFNRSKRSVGRSLRWPSTEVIARVLTLCEMTYAEFGALVDEKIKIATDSPS